MAESDKESPPVVAAYGGLAEGTVVGRAQDGDIQAFELLTRHYQGELFRLAYRLLGDRSEAEDALQDTMVLVWRKLPQLADTVVFRSWIYQIMTRRCMSLLRTRARRRTDAVEADSLARLIHDQQPLAGHAPDPAEAALNIAELHGLNQALSRLSAEQRACWVLRELHELSYPEIASATNLPLSTVRGRIARARLNLVKGMDAWR